MQESDGGGTCPPGVAMATAALCQGCGSELHSDDPVRLGYIPPEKLELIHHQDRRRNADLPATAAAPYDPGSALERDRLAHSAAGPQYDDGSAFLLGGMADDGGPGGSSGSGGRGKGAAQKSNIITCARCHDLTFHRGQKTPMLPSDQVGPNSLPIPDASLIPLCIPASLSVGACELAHGPVTTHWATIPGPDALTRALSTPPSPWK